MREILGTKRQQFCTFYLKDQFFGVPVEEVQEVIRYQQMTTVPLVSDMIRGLINLRGQIVMAVDLRRRLGMEDRPTDDAPMNVVVRCDDGVVSFLVDAIGDVLEMDDGCFEPPPENVRGKPRSLILGVHKLSGQLMHVLDVRKTCTLMGQEEADAVMYTLPAGKSIATPVGDGKR
jgi:purine-binding chemotaxis protein CheW